MGINMDIRNEPAYTFLKLDDLDETERNAIRAILRPNTGVDTLKLPWDIGEKEYEVNAEVAEGQEEEMQNQWQHYGMAESIAGYEGCGVTTSPIMTAIPPGHPYAGHQMITGLVYSTEIPGMGNPYSSSATGEPEAYSYVPRLQYVQPPPMYSPSSELMSPAPSGRENERRGGRGRGGSGGGSGKRDSYNRGSNMNNDMQQTGYVVPQPHQYSQMVPMCHSSGAVYSVPAQAHPTAGAPIFLPPQAPGYGPQAQQIYRNNHGSYSHHSSSYPTESHMNTNKFRSSHGQTTYYSQDSQKSVSHKHHETRVLQRENCPTSTPPFRHGSSNYESETSKKNHGKSLIVNNTSLNAEARNNTVHNNTNARFSDKKVSLSTNHNNSESTDVVAIKEDHPATAVEKKEVLPVTAIDSNALPASGVVKDKATRENEAAILLAEEKVTPVSQAESPPKASVKIAEIVEQIEVKNVPKVTQEEPIVAKVPETSATTLLTSVAPPVTVTSGQTLLPPPSVTWANVLKKGPTMDSMRSTPPITKLPVARVAPILPPQPVESVPPTKTPNQDTARNETNAATGNRNGKSNTETTATKGPEVSAWAETKAPAENLQPNNVNDPTVFRMGELLLKYQMDKQTVSLLPRGLTNRSNYCYINSILQALLACPPFYNLLMALPYRRNTTKNSTTPLIDNMVRFVREFNPLTEGARVHRKDRSQKRGEETAADVHCGVAFEPSYVYTMLKNTSCAGVFSVEGRQEDAEEFLSCLLNGISDEMLELMKVVNAEPNDTASDEGEPNVSFNNEEEWKVMGPKNKGSITRRTEFARTPLSDIFRGQLRSRVIRTGEDATDNVQPFFTLQLDIEKAESVDVALETLVGKDQVEGMTCSKTKQQIEAWKQVTLEELPVILILHLKWFDYKMDGCSKIFKRVEFPIDLKLDSKVLSPNVGKTLQRKQKQYKLFAVTYHDGREATKGHYVTDAFHVGYSSWVRYDDSSVKGIYEMDVLNPTPPRVPYLLYYRRCDTIGNNPPNTPRTR